ncbi:hypothetical protein FSLSAGS3026_10985 [Streptococcus agalactiae FSL S3-026]|nr:hypothetical protein FSLSAGS3026_10985 [Streptococcus agalactiae FSL S3-026]
MATIQWLTGHINLTYYQELISQIQVKEV